MGAVVLRGTARSEHPLTFAERALYHQVHRFMPPWLQAVRVFGVAVVFYAAWYHVPAGVISGLALIAVCWANGLVRHGAAPRA
ncbi:MAG: hypothetical protein E6I18_07240 [Chloroflexi bacterium]|nr:MAG: hypothetical protein E6I18_07240 [Chloroflexota bacterium]